ncbi:acid sphingomyelinase-like phosphodiesterase 3b [Physella acuta]|uniref:acid sphingomyelinase-like phosphodiesterase 3b n=1 Tax=Physella acuta TaxID=109671 RepID=UPI0027DAFCAA|nr:acid sphingomyelinase-like phosphodiesterase 3b [Physella acuta]
MGLVQLFGVVIAVFSVVTADSGYFWHVTDFHYDPTYWGQQLSCNDVVPTPGVYGDYWCDSPWVLVQDSIENMGRIRRDVDFVIWTGDNVAHISDTYMSLNINLAILQNITTALNKTFPGVPFYPSLGNHDFYPSDQASGSVSEMYLRMSEIWADWIVDPQQIELFKKGGYYTKLIRPKLRLLALNTVLYMEGDHVTTNLTDPAGQFQWIDAVLAGSRSAGEKVIITGHVPPTLVVPSLLNWFQLRFHARFINLLTSYSDIILAHHYGHDHSDSFRILQRDDGMGATPVFIAPSITPWRYRIPTETGEPHNPGIRLVEYDRDTGRHLNYRQFFINVTDSNRRNATQWEELYNFQTAFGVPDMSLGSLKAIYKSMDTVDSSHMKQCCNYLLVTNLTQDCTDAVQAGIWCGGQMQEESAAKICVNEYVHKKKRTLFLADWVDRLLAQIVQLFSNFWSKDN